jgi:hypothetical protein
MTDASIVPAGRVMFGLLPYSERRFRSARSRRFWLRDMRSFWDYSGLSGFTRGLT